MEDSHENHAVLIVVSALLIGIVPIFTDCDRGRALSSPDGRSIAYEVPLDGRAELALALPIAAVGGLMAFGRRRGVAA